MNRYALVETLTSELTGPSVTGRSFSLGMSVRVAGWVGEIVGQYCEGVYKVLPKGDTEYKLVPVSQIKEAH